VPGFVCSVLVLLTFDPHCAYNWPTLCTANGFQLRALCETTAVSLFYPPKCKVSPSPVPHASHPVSQPNHFGGPYCFGTWVGVGQRMCVLVYAPMSRRCRFYIAFPSFGFFFPSLRLSPSDRFDHYRTVHARFKQSENSDHAVHVACTLEILAQRTQVA